MARNSVAVRSRSAERPGLIGAWRRVGAAVLAIGLASCAGPMPIAASGILRDLTAADRSQMVVLSDAGGAIPRSSLGHPNVLRSQGTVPAYTAFPLHGGERLPGDLPTLNTGSQSGGSPVGPLDLTATTQPQLNADLQASGAVIVDTPGQSYAVSFLPRYAVALSRAEASAASASATTGAGASTSTTGSTTSAESGWSVDGIPTSELSKWLDEGTSELSHLTSLGINGVAKTLDIKGLKVTTTSSGLNFAAQYLTPTTPTNSSATPLAAPIPEPGTWMIFGLILGAAALRRRG